MTVSCCDDGRLQGLRAAAGPAHQPADDTGAATGAIPDRGTAPVVPQDLELVTVTDTTFVLTWFTGDRLAGGPEPPVPVPADSVVRYGTAPDRLDGVVTVGGDTAFHHVEVTGLTSGVTYWYRAVSGGREATARVVPVLHYEALDDFDLTTAATPEALQALALGLLAGGGSVSASPGQVTTLIPPPGRLLATVALSNDLHAGEEVSGLAVGDYPPGFSQAPGLPPYPEVMAAAMVADVAARGADVLVVAGDLTSAARPAEVAASRVLLDAFGPLGIDGPLDRGSYVVARGNHDQPRPGEEWAEGVPVPGAPEYHDAVPAVYGLTQGQMTVTELAGLRLIGLDTTTLDRPGGAIDDDQFAHLEALLASAPDQPTVVFGHHPVTEDSARTVISGPDFVLDRSDGERLERLYARTPGVFLHHAGHTHRNRRTTSPVAPSVEFLEVAAIKEYPGGYSLLRLYEGGYMVNFYKSSGPGALAWSHTTAGEYLGLYPAYVLGSLEDRNHVVVRDLSGLSPARSSSRN